MPLTRHDARTLGQLLCDTTEEVLWAPSRDRIRRQRPGARLECRVGSGQATWHRFDPALRQHCITYGVRMILAKYQADTAAGWLSAREIRKRRYFDGRVSTRTLLAHTCCHEFAHLLQQVAGQRLRGSVHNQHFYHILDELHASGAASEVKDRLTEGALKNGLPFPDSSFESPPALVSQTLWQAGDRVTFGSRGRCHTGLIQRVNRKTCTVKGTGPSTGLRYRVPFSLLSRPEP
ncbi:hypothetical protein [Marinobacter sp.]|uniref:hypothetical protein n=1 Tax=Marinobacter sp. TaxID=50741 RepID=UPI003850B84F